MKISGVIITLNEEKLIEDCLRSLEGVVDEIIVVDSYSTDRTVEICKSFGATVKLRKFTNHIDQKNYAVSLAANDLVLFLDADESLSPELRSSILALRKSGVQYDGYSMNRKSLYSGRWLKYAWYPDKKIRLWDKSKGAFDGENPHDKVDLKNGTCFHLKGDILHQAYDSIEEHREQLSNYVEIAAQAKFRSGKQANWLIHIVLGPLFKFIRLYIFKGGILDGYRGFAFSMINAKHNYQKYRRLRELHMSKSAGNSIDNLFVRKPHNSFR